ncbi:MAG: hypothetical protein JXA37_10175 [Chloroflexia bacterium]|nr:hypothetical protein [Chloroflexia bacterium]
MSSPRQAVLFFCGRLVGILLAALLLLALLLVGMRALFDTFPYLDNVPDSVYAELARRYSPREPFGRQYGLLLKGLWGLDLGPSLQTDRPVSTFLGLGADAGDPAIGLPVTLQFVLPAWGLSVVLALGLICLGRFLRRLRERSPVVSLLGRRLGQLAAAFSLAALPLAGGLLLFHAFAEWGWHALIVSEQGPEQYALPLLLLAPAPALLLARAVLGELGSARAGEARGRLLLLGLDGALAQLPAMLGLAVVVEQLALAPGLGRLLLIGVGLSDHTLVLAMISVFLLMGVAAVLLRALVQAGRRWISDPPPVEAVPPVGDAGPQPASPGRRLWLALALLLALLPLLAGVVSWASPDFYRGAIEQRRPLSEEDLAPGPGQPLGRDALGRDLYHRLVVALGVDLGVGLALALGMLLLAAPWAWLLDVLCRRRQGWAGWLAELLSLPLRLGTLVPGVGLLLLYIGWANDLLRKFLFQPTEPSIAVETFAEIELGSQRLLLAGIAIALVLLPRLVRSLRADWQAPGRRGRGRRLGGLLLGNLALYAAGGAMATMLLGFLGRGPMAPLPELGMMLAQNAMAMRASLHLLFYPAGAAILALGAWFLLAETLPGHLGLRQRRGWLEWNT